MSDELKLHKKQKKITKLKYMLKEEQKRYKKLKFEKEQLELLLYGKLKQKSK